MWFFGLVGQHLMKPRWFAFCYTCHAYHVLETRKRIREWKAFHRKSTNNGPLYHRVMLYRIDKFTVVS